MTSPRKFDWRSEHDERSRQYDISSVIDRGITPRKQMWQEGTVLDQGQEGACVGFGWTAEFLAEPVPPASQPAQNVGNAYARLVYGDAKKLDEYPGENYEGTSVLAGAKAMVKRGVITSYRWCFSIDDVRNAVIQEGPVVIGVQWKDGMYETGPGGIVKVSGKVVGGHCLLITGYDPAMKIGSRKYEVFRWRNSWGKDYGVNGSGYIKATDLAKLLKTSGEACVPMGRLTGPLKSVTIISTIKNRVLTLFKK
jgi:hypothetical protein